MCVYVCVCVYIYIYTYIHMWDAGGADAIPHDKLSNTVIFHTKNCQTKNL